MGRKCATIYHRDDDPCCSTTYDANVAGMRVALSRAVASWPRTIAEDPEFTTCGFVSLRIRERQSTRHTGNTRYKESNIRLYPFDFLIPQLWALYVQFVP
jgi:hypothetical protein